MRGLPPASRAAVERLVDAHYEGLFRYAARLTGSSADAEDLTQETFGKALGQIEQLREPDRAKAWLFAILRNLYLQRLRTERTQRLVPLEAAGELPEPSPEPLPEVEPERLQAALAELPETFRTPVILFYFEDFAYRDIAEQMDIPIGTVMSRLARAKAWLRSRLAPTAVLTAGGRATDGL